MEISRKQKQSIQNMNNRINILHGSVRSGKTVGSLLKWIHYCEYGPRGPLVMIGKTERTLKRNIIDPLLEMIGNGARYFQGRGELFIGRRKVYVAGANDEKAEGKIRGLSLAGAYGDEISLWPESLFRMLLSRLSIDGAQLFCSTNPDSPYHWLKEDYLDKEGLDLYQLHFNIDDNPFLSQTFKDNLKKEYTGLWYKRFIDGLWVLADGVIYDMFNPSIHEKYISETRLSQYENYIVSVDYGTSNPFTAGLFGFNSAEDVMLLDEYYYDGVKKMKQKTDGEYADDVRQWLDNLSFDKSRLTHMYIDPSALSFITECKKREWDFQIKEADNDVLDGIRFVSNMIANNQFIVSSDCRETLKEFSSYVWDEKAQKRGEDKPLKSNDHCMDRNRYALYSHFKKRKLVGTF